MPPLHHQPQHHSHQALKDSTSAFVSNHLCAIFSRETESERIERKFKTQNSKPISSELLSSDPDKSSVELSLDCKAGLEGNLGALFSLPYSIRPDFDSTLKNLG